MIPARTGLPITPDSPYSVALDALRRGCRDDSERADLWQRLCGVKSPIDLFNALHRQEGRDAK